MTEIENRLLFTISADLSIAANASQTVTPTLRFAPDAFIVRQIAYGGDAAAPGLVYQIYCSLAQDLIIGVFPSSPCFANPDTVVSINSVQSTINMNFQFLTAPANQSGFGTPIVAGGKLALLIEFIRYKH